MTKIADLKKRLMEDPTFKQEYQAAEGEIAIIEALVKARTHAKLSQADLAKKIGTTQSAVARLEGGHVSPLPVDAPPLCRGDRGKVEDRHRTYDGLTVSP